MTNSTPARRLMAVLAHPITRLVYQRGVFGEEGVQKVHLGDKLGFRVKKFRKVPTFQMEGKVPFRLVGEDMLEKLLVQPHGLGS